MKSPGLCKKHEVPLVAHLRRFRNNLRYVCRLCEAERKRRIKRKEPDLHTQARMAVYRAVKGGLLVRCACHVCGEENSEAHHEDYFKPLEVVWLCRAHHKARHRELESFGVKAGSVLTAS